MQVQSTQTVTPEYSTTQTQKNDNSSTVKFDTSKTFDLNTFSFEDYKNISAQELSDWIMNGDRPGDGFEAITFNNLASYTDDDDLNEIIFDKAKELFKQNDGSMRGIFESFLLPLANMNSPIEIKEDTFYNNKPIPYQEDYVNKFDEYATRSSLYSIDNVLNNIKNMPDFYEKNTPGVESPLFMTLRDFDRLK